MDNQEIKALLPIEERGERKLVNARMLHEFLGVKDHFRTWINRRIEGGRFVEDRDFVKCADLREIPRGRPATEYGLTMRMAQHICMMARTPKGEQARDYFIECEKIAKKSQKQLPGTYLDALKQLVSSEEEKVLLQERTERQTKQLAKATDIMADQAADMQVYDRIMRPEDLISMYDAAKLIDHPMYGPQKIFKLLVKLDMIYETDAKSVPYKPKQKHRRHLKLVKSGYEHGEVDEPYLQVKIRLCGINYVVKRIIEESGGWDGLKGRERLAREFRQKLDQPVGNTGGLFE